MPKPTQYGLNAVFFAKWSHLKVLIVSLIVALVLPLSVGLALLKWWVLPNINAQKAWFEEQIERVVNQPVQIQRISGQWQGLSPQLELLGLQIGQASEPLVASRVRVQFTLARWLRFNPNSSNIEVDGLAFALKQNSSGQWCVLGHCFTRDEKNPSKALKTLLQQKRILLRDAQMMVILASDSQRFSVRLEEAVFKNGFIRHQSAAKLWVGPMLPVEATSKTVQEQKHLVGQTVPLEFRADFQSPVWKPGSSLIADWQGHAYFAVDLPDTQHLQTWHDLFNTSSVLSNILDKAGLKQVKANVRLWTEFEQGQVQSLGVQLQAPELNSNLDSNDFRLRDVDVFVEIDGEKSITQPNRITLHHARATQITQSRQQKLRLGSIQVWRNVQTQMPYGIKMQSQNLEHVLQAWRLLLPSLSPLLKEHEHAIPKGLKPFVQVESLDTIKLSGHLKQFKLLWAPSSSAATGSSQQVALSMPKFNVALDVEQLALLLPVNTPVQHPEVVNTSAEQPIKEMSESLHQTISELNGVSGLDLNVLGSDEQGRWSFTKNQNDASLAIVLPHFFHQSEYKWQQFLAKGRWSKGNTGAGGWQVWFEQVLAANADFKTGFKGVVQLPWPFKPGLVDLQGDITQGQLKQVANYMPKMIGAKVHAWLSQALLGGEAKQGKWQLKGDLSKFPFTKGGGVFKVHIPFSSGRFQFALSWPEIHDISGVAEFSGLQMTVKAKKAKTLNVPLQAVSATINDLSSPQAELLIEGVAEGALPDMLAYTKSSPLETISAAFASSHAEGAALLNLRLGIPLQDVNHPKVDGHLKLAGNRFQINPSMPMVSQLTGAVHFTEQALTFNGLKGQAMGGELMVDGATQSDGALLFTANGTAQAQGLGDYLRSTLSIWPSSWLNGQTQYQVQVLAQKDKTIKLDVRTDLQGMAIALPAPLGKSKSDAMSLHVEQLLDPKEERINIDFGEDGRIAQARILMQQKENRRVIEGMQFAMGAVLPTPAKGTQGELRIPVLNIEAWRTAITDLQQKASTSQANAGQISNLMNASHAFIPLPVRVRMRSDEAIWSGKTFQALSVTAKTIEKRWQLDIQGKGVEGYLQFSSDPNQPDGTVLARFKKLSIPKSTSKENAQVVEESTKSLPALDVMVEDFAFNGKDWGRLALKAVNLNSTITNLAPSNQREWRIQELRIDNPDSSIQAQGSWRFTPGLASQHTELELEQTVKDAGGLLRRLGFKEVFKGGKASLQAKLRWNAGPDELDWASLSGTLKLNSRNGQFLKADPGVAKLLGVLSLQSIPRRLTLDFKDLFSAGFAYDTLEADVILNQGVATTRNLKMVAPSATVLMEGQFDLSKETQQLNVVVLPDLNATAGSLLYSILIANPAVGLASLLADYWLKDPISKVFSVQYQVSGSWNQPIIERMNAKPNDLKPNVESSER